MRIIQPFYIIHAAFVVGRKVNAALLQSAVDGDQTGVAFFNSFYGIFLTACGVLSPWASVVMSTASKNS